jgi:hypothetical protein
MVAYLLKGRKEEGVPARRLALLREVYEKDQLNEEDMFDLAYLLGEADETAEAVKVYEHYTREYEGSAAFFNLALGYRALDRDADALDALEAARRTGYEPENLTTVRSSVQKRLFALREQVLRTPQPYLPHPVTDTRRRRHAGLARGHRCLRGRSPARPSSGLRRPASPTRAAGGRRHA